MFNLNFFKKTGSAPVPVNHLDETESENASEIRFVKRTGTYTKAEHAATYATGPSFPDRLPWVEFLDDDKALLLEDGRSEPMLALDGGDDGLQLFPKLAAGIKNALAENGAFFVECGEYNIDAAYDIFFEAGLHELKIHKDLNNQKRIISGKN